ncbi:MAG TPA: PEP-CTERM sorting domain-containing protein, partial [Methyloversatilis sp.]
TIVNGLLEAQTVEIEDGVLKGRDRVSTTLLTVGANTTVSPGTSPGTLTVLGSMVISGVLELELSAAASDRLDVSGTLVFTEGATVRFSFLDGLLPDAGRRYDFADQVSAGGGVFGLEQVRFELTGLPPGRAGTWDGSGFTVAAVPEPATCAMLAAGLVVVACSARRRRADAGRGINR